MNEQIVVTTLRSLAELEQVRLSWSLWQHHPNSDIEFYLDVLNSSSTIIRPHVLTLCHDGQLKALLIGRLENVRVPFRFGYLKLFSLDVVAITFIYGGLIGDTSDIACEAFVKEIKKSLREGEANIAFFNHLRKDSNLCKSVLKVPGALARDYFPLVQNHRLASIPETTDEFYSRLSSKVRKNLKWQAKKLLQEYQGKVEIRSFQRSDEIELMARDVEMVARKTYQRGLGVGFTDNEILRNRLRLLGEKEWLRAYLLYIEDSPCAFWIGTLYRGTFHSDFMGYDPAYGKYSPGMYLITSVIETFCSHREVDAIDFGLGDTQYKEVLGDCQWHDASLYIFGPSLRSLVLNVCRSSIQVLLRAGQMLLERGKLLPKIKQVWRARLRSA